MEQTQKKGTFSMIRRFLPYLLRYKKMMIFDLFCAALTTLCDIVLPKIMGQLTNAATDPAVVLTVETVLKLAMIYFVLRVIDGLASYYMSSRGHKIGRASCRERV